MRVAESLRAAVENIRRETLKTRREAENDTEESAKIKLAGEGPI
jgi:hypothetical protein